MTVFAETSRTILREIMMEDVDGFFEMDSDTEVHRYLGTLPAKSKDQIEETIQHVRQQYIDNGIGRWAIIDKSTNKFIGWTGLKLVKEQTNDRSNYHDLGYRLIRKYWGQGIATETAPASLAYGFGHMHIDEIIATVHCANTASNRVAVKLGFELDGTFYLHGMKHNWYKMEKSDWMINKS